jgi:hypothetical protein
VDREFYYNAVGKMQDKRVNPEYIQGWIGGYLGNPKREEQRITEPYEAGYEDGGSSDVSKFEQWPKG